MSTVRLGTRGSPLALVQANAVAARIREAGGPSCEIVIIKTTGDRLSEAPLDQIGGKRLFVKEIEDALLAGAVDLAVHSAKDLPALLVDGLELAGALPREDPADALILPQSAGAPPRDVGRLIADLGPSPRIGTGSVRRIAQLRDLFPGARFEGVRGNLDTRLRKLDKGDYDLLVLAAAGIRRLGYAARVSATLPLSTCVPAPGQGIIAIEIRAADAALCETVTRVADRDAVAALAAERALVAGLGGGCQMPIGALAVPTEQDGLELNAVVASLDGSRSVRCRQRGSRRQPAALGAEVSRRLVEDGAMDILQAGQRAQPPAHY